MPIEPFQVTKIVVGSSFSDPGLTRLTPRPKVDNVDTIARLSHLTELVLFNTTISDADLLTLANIRQLETLRLDGSAITDDGLTHLHNLKNLKHLTLTRTAVTDTGIAELRKALPACKIVAPDAEVAAP
jgi:Leucine-rich repeat (LRR) protein